MWGEGGEMSIEDIVEEIRQEQKWSSKDVILVIRTDRENLPLVEKALNDVGISNNDGVEIVLQKEGK